VPSSIRRTFAGVASLALATALAVSVSIGAAAQSDEPLTIGVSYPTSNSPFWQAYLDFIGSGAEQLGVTINAVSADTNEQKQVADIQNLISQGVDGMIITPQSTAVAPRLIQMIDDAGIPVVVVDRYPGYDPGTNAEADYVAFLGPNDVQAGKGIAEALIADGGDKILALGGLDGSSVAEGRKEGLNLAVDEAGATLVQYLAAGETEELGLSNMESMLQAHPGDEANAVWCYNDNLCMGGIKAAQNADRMSDFVFGGMDLTPAALAAIEDGTYAVSFGGHWLQGGFGLVALYDYINGLPPKNPIVKLDLLQVDASNIAAFNEQYIDNPPTYDFKELSQVFNPDATGSFEITLQ
jgi:ABC-type sugar transport system substrate-binding protein